jgi:phenylpropionate dioxygenase-like ring-hydroxylating dioxygenase large terminal subunit
VCIFEPVARSEAVVRRKFVRVVAHGRPVLVSRTSDGTAVAFGAICPHQQKELDEGTMWEDEIDCPHHHYTYDPGTGRNLFPARVFPASRAARVRGIPVFEVREECGWVWVGPRKPPAEGVQVDE